MRRLALALLVAMLLVVPVAGIVGAAAPDSSGAATASTTPTSNATATPTPTATPALTDDLLPGEHTLEELEQRGSPPGDAPTSYRGLPDGSFVALRYSSPNPISAPWQYVQQGTGFAGTTVRNNQLTVYSSRNLNAEPMDVTVVLAFYEVEYRNIQVGNRTVSRQVAVNQSTVERDLTLEGGIHEYNVQLPAHYDGVRMAVWLERDGAAIEGARWAPLRHETIDSARAVDIDTESDVILWGFGNVFLSGIFAVGVGLRSSRAVIKRTGTGPRFPWWIWAILGLFAMLIGFLVGFYQITSIFTRAPWLMGLALFVPTFVAGLGMHPDVKKILALRPELEDAKPLRNNSRLLEDADEDDELNPHANGGLKTDSSQSVRVELNDVEDILEAVREETEELTKEQKIAAAKEQAGLVERMSWAIWGIPDYALERVDGAELTVEEQRADAEALRDQFQELADESEADTLADLKEALYVDTKTIPVIDEEDGSGYLVPSLGIRSFLASIFVGRPRFDDSDRQTVWRGRVGPYEEVIITDPLSTDPVRHRSASLSIAPGPFTRPDGSGLLETIRWGALGRWMFLCGLVMAAALAVGNLLDALGLGLLTGLVGVAAVSASAEPGNIDIDLAPVHFAPVLATVVDLQRGLGDAMALEEWRATATRERLRTSEQAKDELREEHETVTEEVLGAEADDGRPGEEAREELGEELEDVGDDLEEVETDD